VFAYTRSLGHAAAALILLNFEESTITLQIPEHIAQRFNNSTLILCNYEKEEGDTFSHNLKLKGFEGRVYI
jgi:hypothetical protein